MHADDHVFACQYCNSGFDSKTALELHLQVHIIDRPFACEVCKKRFMHKSAMTRHMKSHEL